MMNAVLKAVFFVLLYRVVSCSTVDCNDPANAAASAHKTRCLNDAISCLSGDSVGDDGSGNASSRLETLEREVATLKAELKKAGQPSGFALLDQNGRLPQNLLTAGYEQYSAFDLAWQALHMAAAAACRGSTASGGSGCCENKVLARNTGGLRTCAQICGATHYSACDAEVSLDGEKGKATRDGQIIGAFYNYGCNHGVNGGSEASAPDNDIMRSSGYPYYSFCCCRKPS